MNNWYFFTQINHWFLILFFFFNFKIRPGLNSDFSWLHTITWLWWFIETFNFIPLLHDLCYKMHINYHRMNVKGKGKLTPLQWGLNQISGHFRNSECNRVILSVFIILVKGGNCAYMPREITLVTVNLQRNKKKIAEEIDQQIA